MAGEGIWLFRSVLRYFKMQFNVRCIEVQVLHIHSISSSLVSFVNTRCVSQMHRPPLTRPTTESKLLCMLPFFKRCSLLSFDGSDVLTQNQK
jgi:hypothetical protein